MTDAQITALRAAGVWPEMLDYDTDGVFCWHEHNQWAVLPWNAAEAMLIVAMMDALPDEWAMYRYKVTWHITDDNSEMVTGSDDEFQALFSALVAAGIVKETHIAD